MCVCVCVCINMFSFGAMPYISDDMSDLNSLVVEGINVRFPVAEAGLDADSIAAAATAAGAAAAASNPEKEEFLPHLLPSRKRERDWMGPAVSREECFLCAYFRDGDTAINSKDMERIVKLIRENYGRMDSAKLGILVERSYEKLRNAVNASALPGGNLLPEFNAATFLEHCRLHQQDAETKQLTILSELQEVRQELLGTVLERSSKTGQIRGNKGQIDNLCKIIKLELEVQSKDPSKMACFSSGGIVNPAIHRQGVVASANKLIMNMWSGNEKRRTGGGGGGGRQ